MFEVLRIGAGHSVSLRISNDPSAALMMYAYNDPKKVVYGKDDQAKLYSQWNGNLRAVPGGDLTKVKAQSINYNGQPAYGNDSAFNSF
mmetsp:Transcript_12656/g.19912  ORF Transcript_12656/g.19912 Transcript_12656/m.19912 type:complete len:88 (-) Transcript_12656:799-1062(-)